MPEFTNYSNVKISDQLYIKPEYKGHDHISGNKLRKLKYNLLEARERQQHTILTFGGAFSNHIAAVASVGKEFGFNTIGVIRGEELNTKIKENPTLNFAQSCGMQFKFVSRSAYRMKQQSIFIQKLTQEFGDFYMLPEGGTNQLAVKGCEDILVEGDEVYDYICCPVGTGGTIAGIINSSNNSQKILGFPALKGNFLKNDITKFANKSNWELINDYHFGGYAKINRELISFINKFKSLYQIPLDPVYTGKMMFGIMNMMETGSIPRNSKVLAIHTGGLQGNRGMNLKLKQQNLPLLI
jgi:1-aminocyclopropane-1-carboxylate deaminase